MDLLSLLGEEVSELFEGVMAVLVKVSEVSMSTSVSMGREFSLLLVGETSLFIYIYILKYNIHSIHS